MARCLAFCLVFGLALGPGSVSPVSATSGPTTDPRESWISALERLTAPDSGTWADRGAPVRALPAQSRPEASLLLRDLWLDHSDFTGPQRRSARSLLARPTSAFAHRAWRYPAGAVPHQRCGERVCVTSVTTSRHAATARWSEETLRLVEAAWSRVVGDLGYRAPAKDGDFGGDDRFDVYLADLGGHDYGFCAPETPVPGQDGRSSSYCVLDNDMAGLGRVPASSLAATAAHEFFHAVQFNYDLAEDRWFMEASATWMEEQVFDDVDDNRQFLKAGQLGDPLTPLDSAGGMYGNWIFVQWLSQQYGAHAVRQVWERLDASAGAPNEWSLQAVSRLIDQRGGSWQRFMSGFARANVAPGRHYDEGRFYRAGGLHDRLRLAPPRRTQAPRSTSTGRVALAHLTSRHVGVSWRGSAVLRQRRVAVRVRSSTPTHTQAQVIVLRTNGTIGVRRVTLGRQGRGTVRVTAPRRVRRLVVVLTHTSIDYRGCGRNSGWSCGGQPARDLRVTVTARLTR